MQARSLNRAERGVATVSNALLLAGIFLTVQFSMSMVGEGTNRQYDVVACVFGVGSMGGTGPDGQNSVPDCMLLLKGGGDVDNPPG